MSDETTPDSPLCAHGLTPDVCGVCTGHRVSLHAEAGAALLRWDASGSVQPLDDLALLLARFADAHAQAIDRAFREGMVDGTLDAAERGAPPYEEGTRLHHWYTRGKVHSARLLRAFEADAQAAVMRRALEPFAVYADAAQVEKLDPLSGVASVMERGKGSTMITVPQMIEARHAARAGDAGKAARACIDAVVARHRKRTAGYSCCDGPRHEAKCESVRADLAAHVAAVDALAADHLLEAAPYVPTAGRKGN